MIVQIILFLLHKDTVILKLHELQKGKKYYFIIRIL